MFTRKPLKWQRTLYIAATELVKEQLASLQQGDNLHGLFLTCLLRNKDIGMQEIYSDMLDLLIAGTDTVQLQLITSSSSLSSSSRASP